MAEKHGVQLLSLFGEEYPPLLKAIPDPPPVLYVKGVLGEALRCVACVGTRSPSLFGRTVSQRLTRVLAENGWTVVSGLAIGVDAISHQAALDAGGRTVAVLANGLDSVYPSENQALARRILDQGGALVSEQPFGARASARCLVQRDRIQSGMSLAVFAMQTDIKGGTMHTVRFALQQGRTVFVPAPPPGYSSEEKSRGIRALAERTGRELPEILAAAPDYARLLRGRFAAQPPAIALRGREEYPDVLARLGEAASGWPRPREGLRAASQSLEPSTRG